MTSVKLINHSSSTADWNYIVIAKLHRIFLIFVPANHIFLQLLLSVLNKATALEKVCVESLGFSDPRTALY